MGSERDRHRDGEQGGAPWLASGFWDEVRDEVSVETMRWNEFALFVAPSDPSGEPDLEFSLRLREHLRALVRRRYTS